MGLCVYVSDCLGQLSQQPLAVSWLSVELATCSFIASLTPFFLFSYLLWKPHEQLHSSSCWSTFLVAFISLKSWCFCCVVLFLEYILRRDIDPWKQRSVYCSVVLRNELIALLLQFCSAFLFKRNVEALRGEASWKSEVLRFLSCFFFFFPVLCFFSPPLLVSLAPSQLRGWIDGEISALLAPSSCVSKIAATRESVCTCRGKC